MNGLENLINGSDSVLRDGLLAMAFTGASMKE